MLVVTSMTSLAKMTDGYGAASFGLPGTGLCQQYVEVQANPTGFKVRYHRGGRTFNMHAVYIGADAVAVGAAVCNGEMPPAILADWCDDNTPARCDHDFNPGAILRKTA